MDNHANFAYSTIATAPSPAASGTSLIVASGDGALFPIPPFNAVIWPTNVNPLASNAEIARVTAIATDTFTVSRAQEETTARSVVIGDQIMAAITKKTLTDIENQFPTVVSATSDQTQNSNTTFVDDAALLFAIGASATEVWFWEAFLLINAPNTTMDLKVTITGPTGATALWGSLGNNSTNFGGFGGTTFGTTPLALTAIAAGLSFGTFSGTMGIGIGGMVFGGGTAGNVKLRWAQNTSDAGTLTRKTGSFLRATKVAS